MISCFASGNGAKDGSLLGGGKYDAGTGPTGNGVAPEGTAAAGGGAYENDSMMGSEFQAVADTVV